MFVFLDRRTGQHGTSSTAQRVVWPTLPREGKSLSEICAFASGKAIEYWQLNLVMFFQELQVNNVHCISIFIVL